MKSDQKSSGLTPAALSAAMKGDNFNFAVAITPGGIEAQEAAGQKVLVQSDTLPIKGLLSQPFYGGPKDFAKELHKLGLIVGDAVDDLFVRVQLPNGWKKEAGGGSYWSYLLDTKGHKRASIFYKAAFYDRSAHMDWLSPLVCTAVTAEGKDQYDTKEYPATFYGVVFKEDAEIFRTEPVIVKDNQVAYDITSRLREEARAWMITNYPDHQNQFAYWSD